MADRKSAFKSSILTKNLTRTKEKVLLKLGKVDETRDAAFDLYAQNFSQQQAVAARLQKELKTYMNCVRAMSTASRSLHEALENIYESDWVKSSEVPQSKETLDLLWDDFQRKMNDQVINPLFTYQSKFPDVKKRVEKRCRKMIDFDSARHNLETLKKKDDAKAAKAQEAYSEAKKMYEDINNEMLEELPALYDSRVPFYAATFQLFYGAEATLHEELGKLSLNLGNIMGELYEETSKGTYDIKRLSQVGSPDVVGNTHLPGSRSGSASPGNSIYEVQVPEHYNEREVAPRPEAQQQQAQPDASAAATAAAPGNEDEDEDDAFEYQVPRPAEPAPAEMRRTSEKDEEQRAVPPLASPETVSPNKSNGELPPGVMYRVRATHNYVRRDSDELTFEKGETIDVLPFDDPDDQDEGWSLGIKTSDGSKGVFPENFTVRL
ncbi:myc box-dependent-interacting protein 1-like [Acanthaster planci]|uniref:Myc box-dependent-interacting protein 1-like n=1 Tax=Acanthaster planci TaxID=133434 RepID=A0A8B7XXU5_ACAPL|nr:myc box-dependent-interacting protein 1-like [Acanthaster planci]